MRMDELRKEINAPDVAKTSVIFQENGVKKYLIF